MNTHKPNRTACVALCLAALGCNGGGGGGGVSELEAMASQIDAETQRQEAEAAQQAKEDAAVAARAKADRLATQSSAVSHEDMQRGQKLKGGGALSTTLRAGIVAEQKMELNMITHALNLYNAEHGHYPRSHEEFMEKIVRFNEIQLDPLQEPYEYWYNADEGQLYKRVKPEAIEQAEREADAAEAAAGE